jgi:DNA repair exonuclease SbcCD nuclease subunit
MKEMDILKKIDYPAVLHLGDIHIKVKNDPFLIKRVITLIDIVKSIPVKDVILAGDIVDMLPTFRDTALLARFLMLDKNFYIVGGNHDLNRRTKYVEEIMELLNLPNVFYCGDLCNTSILGRDVTFASNEYIRKGNKIPKNKGILVSHFACDLPEFDKKAEYPFDELMSYDLVLLGDIHTKFKENETTYYSSSPYRTHSKTISSFEEADNSFFGFNIVNWDTLEVHHIELNLPNVYQVNLTELKEVPQDGNKYNIVVETEYEKIGELRNKDIEVKIKTEETTIDPAENIVDTVTKHLQQHFAIHNAEYYFSLLKQWGIDLEA